MDCRDSKMEYLALLLIATCVSTLYFAYKCRQALQQVAKHDTDWLEAQTHLRFQLDSANCSLVRKHEEISTAQKALVDKSATIRALEETCRESIDRENQAKSDAFDLAERWKNEKNALQVTVQTSQMRIIQLGEELERSKRINEASASASAIIHSLEVRCHLSAEREKELLEEAASKESVWKTEKTQLLDILRSRQNYLAQLTEELKQMNSLYVESQTKLKEAEKAGEIAQIKANVGISVLQAEAAAMSTRAERLSLKVAMKDFIIANLQKYASRQVQEAASDSLQRLRAEAERERSDLQLEVAGLRKQAEETSQAAGQWERKCEDERKQSAELRSVVEARDALVKALEEQLQAALSASQGQTENTLYIECVVCMDNQKCVLFEPCRHICVCQPCSQRLSKCPLCKTAIRKRKVGYLSL